MTPWVQVDESRTPDGTLLTLWRRGRELSIRAGSRVLMGSRRQQSEVALAELALEALAGRARRVLVAGLGFGYTLRAALDRLPPDASVVVSELSPAVVQWNRGVAAQLAGRPLDDPRVSVIVGDVHALLPGKAARGKPAPPRAAMGRASPSKHGSRKHASSPRTPDGAPGKDPPGKDPPGKEARFDAILLDVDNGPQAVSQAGNARLYSQPGLVRLARMLRPGGVLSVWSAGDDDGFTSQLRASGYEVVRHRVRARAGGAADEGGKGERHVVWVATPVRREPRSAHPRPRPLQQGQQRRQTGPRSDGGGSAPAADGGAPAETTVAAGGRTAPGSLPPRRRPASK